MVPTASERLRRLEQILAASVGEAPRIVGPDRDDASLRLERLPLERIRQLTALVERSPGTTDDVDAVVIRLLLNDYASAVAELRAITRAAALRLDAAAEPVGHLRRFLWQDEKLRESIGELSERAASPPADGT